jgi:hypothetical protein
MAKLTQSISADCRILRAAFGRKFLQAALILFTIVLATTAVSFGMVAWMRGEVTDLRAEISELKSAKAELENTIGAWPMKVQNAENGRFIVPDLGHSLKSGWTSGKLPAWKLE